MTKPEQIADAVLKAAGSGGLKTYMPYTQEKIVKAVEEALESNSD